ncbi:hypothetical protein PMI42_01496 [Bradyrhizobium sp. YR681]|nr:hypothetical protein PMI42_01496 [Bradyrhizobium sp. YR681]
MPVNPDQSWKDGNYEKNAAIDNLVLEDQRQNRSNKGYSIHLVPIHGVDIGAHASLSNLHLFHYVLLNEIGASH